MSMVITCPSCGLQGRIRDRNAVNGPVNCPQCGTPVPLPSVDDTPGPVQRTERLAQPIDEFFARAFAGPRLGTLNAAPATATLTEPEPMPNGEIPAEAGAEGEWVREERQRLQTYMHKHFGLLKQQREEFASWRSQVEAALIAREQEVNRQQKLLASRTETVTALEASVAEREAALATQQERITAGEQELQRLHEEERAQRATVQQLQAEVKQLEARASVGREELQELKAAVQHQRHLRAEMENRQVTLQNGERALQQRIAEINETEQRICDELDRQHRDVTRASLELEQRRQQLAQEIDEKELLRRKLAAVSRELERVRRPVAAAKPRTAKG